MLSQGSNVQREVFIGVDIGTGGVRAISFTPDLQQIASSYLEHETISEKEDQAEQDPDEIYRNLLRCLSEVTQSQKVAGIGFSSMLHSVMAINRQGKPLTPLYPFTDNQAQDKVEKFKREVPEFYQKTGCPPHPMYPAFQILWLKEEKPEVFNKAATFLSIKSYILYRLTGELIEDSCIASGTGLLNTHKLSWDEEILDFLGLSSNHLPAVVGGTDPFPIGKVEGLEHLEGVPIYPGAGDGMVAHLAIGGLKEGHVSSTIGTSGALRMATRGPFLDRKGRIWCYHFYKDWWVSGGALNNGGITLRWFRDKLGHEELEEAKGKNMDVYELFDRMAAQVEPGARNLIFLPFLAGERSPNWRPQMRGCFIGLRLYHEKKQMIRSIMEGVMCRLRTIFELLKPELPDKIQIKASGGYTKSKVWPRIQANLFNIPIKVPHQIEAASLGAVMMAVFAQGKMKSLEDFEPEIKEEILPDEEEATRYERIYRKHLNLYGRLQTYFTGEE